MTDNQVVTEHLGQANNFQHSARLLGSLVEMFVSVAMLGIDKQRLLPHRLLCAIAAARAYRLQLRFPTCDGGDLDSVRSQKHSKMSMAAAIMLGEGLWHNQVPLIVC